MDRPEAVSKNIKKILNDIAQNLQTKLEGFKKDVEDLKKKQMMQGREFAIQNSALLSAFDEANRESQSLTNRKHLLKNSIDREESDLSRLEKENTEFQKQVDELEGVNRTLRERKQDAEEKYKMLLLKLQQIKGRAQSKEKEHKELNESYKKFLGLEITKVKENSIKISYKNLGSDCYVVLDFAADEIVVESLPELNLEKLNYFLKERANFYEFVKYVRDQMKQKL